MARVELSYPAQNVHGKMDKRGKVIMRQKKYRAANGAVLSEGSQEAYYVSHPRDFEKNAPKGAELANMRTFGDASLCSGKLRRAGKCTAEELAAMTPEERTHVEELRAELEDLRRRFYAQFKKPDPEAPFEKKLQPGASVLRRKQYVKFDNFIQAIIRERNRQNTDND